MPPPLLATPLLPVCRARHGRQVALRRRQVPFLYFTINSRGKQKNGRTRAHVPGCFPCSSAAGKSERHILTASPIGFALHTFGISISSESTKPSGKRSTISFMMPPIYTTILHASCAILATGLWDKRSITCTGTNPPVLNSRKSSSRTFSSLRSVSFVLILVARCNQGYHCQKMFLVF